MLWVFVCGLSLCLCSCFRSWRKSDREIREHYANRSIKPTFYTIQNDSLKLFVATMGADTLPPLLLIHGAPGAWYGYLNMLDDSVLQKSFHIISIDRLGYHYSGLRKKRVVTSIETHAKAAGLALSLNHSHKKGVVLGRSYGAPIAGQLAILQPQHFDKLMMIAPAIDPEREKFWWFSKPARWWIIRMWLPRQLNVATFEKFAHAKELKKLQKQWIHLKVPATIVQGGQDWIVDPKNMDFARRELFQEANFIYIPEASHFITSTHEGLLRELIIQPFQSHPAKGYGSSND
ncbi:MAG: alpha/beta hydrolase [Spirosomataceae bacterium]